MKNSPQNDDRHSEGEYIAVPPRFGAASRQASSRTQIMSIRSNGRSRRSLQSRGISVRRSRNVFHTSTLPSCTDRRLSMRAFDALLLSDHRVSLFKCKLSVAHRKSFVKRIFRIFCRSRPTRAARNTKTAVSRSPSPPTPRPRRYRGEAGTDPRPTP